ncbi:methyl-accepting chemotaxis protein, partial [Bradyrhizobium sp. INPA01-394B]|nr:methyl-accepting chemotaxis protein [Bradyrhizobium campsiandrae]
CQVVELEADLVADAVQLVGCDLVVLARQRNDLADTAALAGLSSVQSTAKDITSQYLAVSTSVSAFVAKPEPKT